MYDGPQFKKLKINAYGAILSRMQQLDSLLINLIHKMSHPNTGGGYNEIIHFMSPFLIKE